MFHYLEYDKIKTFFKQNGYVVITDVITSDEITNSINEICQHPALLGDYNVDINNFENWDNAYIGDRGFIDINQGLSQNHSQVELEWFWKNRQNPNVVKSFENILDSSELLLSIDRASVIRPSEINPKWKTLQSWLHWDKNPWKYPEFTKIQGLLTLTDHTEDSGGFCCVPGFHKKLSEWNTHNLDHYEKNKYNVLIMVPENDKIQTQITKILAPAGSLIIWDSGLPHCNYPNNGYDFRIAQYITFESKSDCSDYTYDKLKTNFFEAGIFRSMKLNKFNDILTPLGRKITDFDYFENQYTISDKDVEAWKEFTMAMDCEKSGDHNQSIKHYSKASKLSKLLEEIYL